jgi:two-component system sensor histidine kinase PrrB
MTSLGADLETLSRNPQLTAERRAEILDAMTREHARVVALLDGLQRLARGDAEALPDRTSVDVSDVMNAAVSAAQRRHEDSTFVTERVAPALVDGWEGGVRLAIANLLDNAALHGRPGGVIEIALTVADEVVRISVGDDGPGIPPEDRERLLERFARGRATRAGGSGLGLALVEQQARLHGGRLELGDAPRGGLRATLSLPHRGG